MADSPATGYSCACYPLYSLERTCWHEKWRVKLPATCRLSKYIVVAGWPARERRTDTRPEIEKDSFFCTSLTLSDGRRAQSLGGKRPSSPLKFTNSHLLISSSPELQHRLDVPQASVVVVVGANLRFRVTSGSLSTSPKRGSHACWVSLWFSRLLFAASAAASKHLVRLLDPRPSTPPALHQQ
mgnify:CR=1 FL=1